MSSKITPSLAPNTLVKEKETITICAGEYSLEINKWANEIVRLFDGKRSIEEIAQTLRTHYISSAEDMQKKVRETIAAIWQHGKFLDHQIDIPMAILTYGREGFVFLPNFCQLPDLPLRYFDPTYVKAYLDKSKLASVGLGDMALSAGKYNSAGEITSIIILQKTPCRYSYYVAALYGEEFSQHDYANLKKCLYGNLSKITHSKIKEEDPLNLMFSILNKSSEPDCSTWLPVVCRLAKEIDGYDLSIVKMEL